MIGGSGEFLEARLLDEFGRQSKEIIYVPIKDIVAVCSANIGLKPFGSDGLHTYNFKLIATTRGGKYYGLISATGIPHEILESGCQYCTPIRDSHYRELGGGG
ncbi:hypothetical protein HYW99_02915 [Candidatus Woesearchaeota archaeon]|nr:hypothetical protein [Candidatus Woesearchaeota archaeon]